MTNLTSRDRKLLHSIAACQVLGTSQVHQWHFRNVSLNMAQKRLRKLVEAGYLDAMETKVCTDNLLVLGKEGQRQLQQHGWNVELRKEIPKDLAHHMGVVDTRIAIERGLEDMPGLHLRYFYAYWELGRFGWSYPIIPDAIFSVRNAYTAQAALEFDRKTETLGVLAQKLLQYRTLLHRHPLSTVIVVAEKSKDIERLQEGLEHIGTRIPLLIVGKKSIFRAGPPHGRPSNMSSALSSDQRRPEPNGYRLSSRQPRSTSRGHESLGRATERRPQQARVTLAQTGMSRFRA